MRSLAACAAITAALSVLAHLLARLAVEHDAAGALLSPAGLTDPIAWLAAGGFFLARLSSAAMLCLTIALAASRLAAAVLDRVERRCAARAKLPR